MNGVQIFVLQPSSFVSLQIIVDKASQTWTLYDAGPRHVRSPLVCLPPVCGTADVFFRQLLDLTAVGYRVISVRMPRTDRILSP